MTNQIEALAESEPTREVRPAEAYQLATTPAKPPELEPIDPDYLSYEGDQWWKPMTQAQKLRVLGFA